MNPSLLTNTLLAVIAGFLLVLVIQNGTRSGSYQRPVLSPHQHSSYDSQTQPNSSVPPKGVNMETNMLFAALRAFPKGCEGMQTLSECSSPDAMKVKSEIESFAETGKRPREIFDFIVSRWGENALTDQSKQIRNMRIKSK